MCSFYKIINQNSNKKKSIHVNKSFIINFSLFMFFPIRPLVFCLLSAISCIFIISSDSACLKLQTHLRCFHLHLPRNHF